MSTTKTALVLVVGLSLALGGCMREPVVEGGRPAAPVPAPAAAPIPGPATAEVAETPAAAVETPAAEANEAPQAVARSVNAAPDFTLTDIDGKTHTLSDYGGKVVVLEWINHGCPFVKKHYDQGHMQGLQETYTGMDVVWLSICSSAEGKQGYHSAADWKTVNAEKNGAASAILLDTDGRVGRLYGARTTPHMFVLGADGAVAYEGAIDSKKSTRVADIATSTNYVSEVLDAVLAAKPVPHTKTKPYGCSVKYAPGN